MASSLRPPPSPLTRLLIDFGPLIVFFAVNAFTRGPAVERGLIATVAFMITIAAAVAWSWWRTRHVSPMLWISAVMVLIFGGLTLWFQNLNFIQLKPSIYYSALAIALGYGLASGKPLLQLLMGEAYPGLSDRGWRLLTMNWMGFFATMAVANVIVWWFFSYDFWNWFKLWGVIPLTFLFALANIPLLMKHGLQLEKPEDVPLPPEG